MRLSFRFSSPSPSKKPKSASFFLWSRGVRKLISGERCFERAPEGASLPSEINSMRKSSCCFFGFQSTKNSAVLSLTKKAGSPVFPHPSPCHTIPLFSICHTPLLEPPSAPPSSLIFSFPSFTVPEPCPTPLKLNSWGRDRLCGGEKEAQKTDDKKSWQTLKGPPKDRETGWWVKLIRKGEKAQRNGKVITRSLWYERGRWGRMYQL